MHFSMTSGALFDWIWAFLYAAAATVAFIRAFLKGKSSEPAARLLGIYAAASALVSALLAANQSLLLIPSLQTLSVQLPPFALVVLAWWLVEVTRAFLRKMPPRSPFWYAVPAALAVIAVLSAVLPNTQASIGRLGDLVITPNTLLQVTLSGLWAASMAASLLATLTTYRHTTRPLHRNRLRYWTPVLALIAFGQGLTLLRQPAVGQGLHAAGVILACWVLVHYSLPDLRNAFRMALSVAVTALLTAAFYVAILLSIAQVWPESRRSGAVWFGALAAVLLAALFAPLLNLIRRLVHGIIPGAVYDSSYTLRDYSASISNILDLERLEAAAVNTIGQAMEVSSGCLYLVDREETDTGVMYKLHNPRSGGIEEPVVLGPNSPIAAWFDCEGCPITQYDLDFSPQFAAAAPAERSWFIRSGMEVYVPITAHGSWIGLLELGHKLSGDRFFEEDLTLLQTLSSQTAVALENARLVKNLLHVNQQLQDAYDELDKTREHLEELDRSKSDFISIASHELRTPITLISGHSQILAEDPDIARNPFHLQMARGIHQGTIRLHEIVDSMLDVAKIDNRTYFVDANPVAIPSVLRQVCDSLQKACEDRKLALKYSAPQNLPAIQGDVEALYKVFYQLLVNAIKYTPDGGRIALEARAMAAKESPLARDSVEVQVSDTGIGIDPAYQEIIFAKFYHTGETALHSTGKTKFKGGGPGLGLAIAKGIVEAHNGQIWVESAGFDEEAPPGSTFHVVLPVHQVNLSAKTITTNGAEITQSEIDHQP